MHGQMWVDGSGHMCTNVAQYNLKDFLSVTVPFSYIISPEYSFFLGDV
jgi:hypothetical protein